MDPLGWSRIVFGQKNSGLETSQKDSCSERGGTGPAGTHSCGVFVEFATCLGRIWSEETRNISKGQQAQGLIRKQRST